MCHRRLGLSMSLLLCYSHIIRAPHGIRMTVYQTHALTNCERVLLLPRSKRRTGFDISRSTRAPTSRYTFLASVRLRLMLSLWAFMASVAESIHLVTISVKFGNLVVDCSDSSCSTCNTATTAVSVTCFMLLRFMPVDQRGHLYQGVF